MRRDIRVFAIQAEFLRSLSGEANAFIRDAINRHEQFQKFVASREQAKKKR